MQGVNSIDSSVFREHRTKYFIRFIDLFLKVIYTFFIFNYSDHMMSNITAFLLGTAHMITILQEGKRFLEEYKEFTRFEKTIKMAMKEHVFEEGKEEDCGICMEKMKVARRLPCNHCFHQFCLMQLILQRRTACPICRSDIYTGDQRTENERREEQVQGNLRRVDMGNLLRNAFVPILRRNEQLITEPNIIRVQEIYPNITRDQIIQEIARHNSVEQAIIAIAERLN